MSDTVRTDERLVNADPRRDFLKTTAAATAGFTIVPRHVLGAGIPRPATAQHRRRRRRRHGPRQPAALSSQNIVALCDVDWDYAGRDASLD